MSDLYLIITPDGADISIQGVNAEGLVDWLNDASEFADNGGWSPTFLNSLPIGQIETGNWSETDTLILKVSVTVPKSITTKWAID